MEGQSRWSCACIADDPNRNKPWGSQEEGQRGKNMTIIVDLISADVLASHSPDHAQWSKKHLGRKTGFSVIEHAQNV